MLADLFAAVPDVSTGPRTFACACGGREELRGFDGDWFPCGWCNLVMRPIVPRYAPPAGAGRELTSRERRALAL